MIVNLSAHTLPEIRSMAERHLRDAVTMAEENQAAPGEVSDLATLASALFAYAAERDLAEAKLQAARPTPPWNILPRSQWGFSGYAGGPESATSRHNRRNAQRRDGQPYRKDIYGMEVCECAGSPTAAPLVDGMCLRRWAYDTLDLNDVDDMSVEQIIRAMRVRIDGAPETVEWVEGDRFLVLLTCGHWWQTRVPEPTAKVFDCPFCGQQRRAARLHGQGDPRAVLSAWDSYDTPTVTVSPGYDQPTVYVVRARKGEVRMIAASREAAESALRQLGPLDEGVESYTIVPWHVQGTVQSIEPRTAATDG